MDAVYQTNAWNMCGVNPAGRRLAGIPTGTFQQQRDLTALTRLGPQEDYQCTDHERPHSWIKEYYWGTVALNGGSPNRPSMWYPTNGGTGSGLGFDRWWHQGGFEQEPDPSLQRVRCVVADDVVPYVWSPFNPLNENRASDRNDVPPLIFNGDFELPNLDGGIGGTEGKSLAGWYYFGGEGRAFVGSEDGNSYLDLGGNNALVAQHNRFFLPLEAQDLLFGINIRFVPVTPMFDEYLEVRIGSQVVRAFSITDVTDEPEPRFVNLRNFPGLLGRVNTLTFELVTALVGESPRVRLDNINIVTDPTSWIDSFYRFDQSNWRLIWRSWPSATITLEASSNLSTWAPIQSSSGAGDAGSFTIANTTGQRFFRLKAVPER